MSGGQQRDLVIILARELAANLATAMFIVDPDGLLVFYNEPAERLLGRQFSGPLSLEEWSAMWDPHDVEGVPIPADQLPLSVALRERQPSHRTMRIAAHDEEQRTIEVTAYPLFSRVDEFVGAVAIFW